MLKSQLTTKQFFILLLLLSPFYVVAQEDSVAVWEDKASLLSSQNDTNAIVYYNKLINHYNNVDSIPKSVNYIIQKGVVFLKRKRFSEARNEFNQAIDIGTANNLNKETGIAYNNIGAIHKYENNVAKALKFFQLASEEFGQSTDNKLYATSLLNLGIMYKKHSVYDKASHNLFEAATIFDNIKDSTNLASAYNMLANIQFEVGDTLNTLELFNKSLSIRKQLGHKKDIAKSYNNIGLYYFSLTKLDSAEFYFEKSLQIKNEINDHHLLASTYTNIADIFLNKEEYSKAIENFELSLFYSRKSDNKEEISEASTKLATTYYELKQIKKAKIFQQVGENNANDISNLELLKDNLIIKIKILKQEQNFNDALIASSQLLKVKDKILSQAKNEALTEMQIKYEVEEQKKENDLLHAENSQQQAQLEAEEFKNILSGVVIAALLVLSIILYIVFRQRSRHNKLLQALLNEQQHRIKNFLQTIGGIFRMHARKAEHEEVKAAVKEGSDRLEAMMLIHKQLYQPSIDAPASVNFTQFTEQLIAHISSAYAGNNEIISPELNLDAVDLEVNKAVALGLILNEVVNNSFKYAIPHTDNPQIKIQLKSLANSLKLTISDNGPGLPENPNKYRKGSLGMNLIKLFSKNLNAKYKFTSNDGAHFELQFNL